MAKKRKKRIHIKFQFTESRKKDIFRFLFAGFCFFLMITVYWNQSQTPLSNLESGYQGYVLQGNHQKKMLNEEGVALIKTWLEEQSKPTINPFRILATHRRSQSPDKHFQLAIGMMSEAEDAIREYAIYQTEHTIYLQVEPMGIDRVLSATFSPEELETALMPYLEGEFVSTATTTP